MLLVFHSLMLGMHGQQHKLKLTGLATALAVMAATLHVASGADRGAASIRALANGDVVIDALKSGTVRVPSVAIQGNVSKTNSNLSQEPALLLFMQDADFHIKTRGSGSGELYIDGIPVRKAFLPTDCTHGDHPRFNASSGRWECSSKWRTKCSLVATNSVYSLNDGGNPGEHVQGFVMNRGTHRPTVEDCLEMCESNMLHYCSVLANNCHGQNYYTEICTNDECGCGGGGCYVARYECHQV